MAPEAATEFIQQYGDASAEDIAKLVESGNTDPAAWGDIVKKNVTSGKNLQDALYAGTLGGAMGGIGTGIRMGAESLSDKGNTPNIPEESFDYNKAAEDAEAAKYASGEVQAQPAPTDFSSGVNAQNAMQYLMDNGGLSKEAAAGIIGNIVQESTFNSNALNDQSGAYGLAQWMGPRKETLNQFAAERGTDPSDIQTQLDFLIHELNTTEGKAKSALESITDPAEAAWVFRKEFERPGEEEANDTNREQAAIDAYNGFSETTSLSPAQQNLPPEGTGDPAAFLNDYVQRMDRNTDEDDQFALTLEKLAQEGTPEEIREAAVKLGYQPQTAPVKPQATEPAHPSPITPVSQGKPVNTPQINTENAPIERNVPAPSIKTKGRGKVSNWTGRKKLPKVLRDTVRAADNGDADAQKKLDTLKISQEAIQQAREENNNENTKTVPSVAKPSVGEQENRNENAKPVENVESKGKETPQNQKGEVSQYQPPKAEGTAPVQTPHAAAQKPSEGTATEVAASVPKAAKTPVKAKKAIKGKTISKAKEQPNAAAVEASNGVGESAPKIQKDNDAAENALKTYDNALRQSAADRDAGKKSKEEYEDDRKVFHDAIAKNAPKADDEEAFKRRMKEIEDKYSKPQEQPKEEPEKPKAKKSTGKKAEKREEKKPAEKKDAADMFNDVADKTEKAVKDGKMSPETAKKKLEKAADKAKKVVAKRKGGKERANDIEETKENALKQVSGDKHISKKDNIENGKLAVQKILSEHVDVPNAMYREDAGNIDFVWGTPGTGAKFKHGYGISHIVAKRASEGHDAIQILNNLVEAIAKGTDVVRQNSSNGGNSNFRLKIHYNGYTAVLSSGSGNKNTWLLTGWEEEKEAPVNASSEGYDSTAATAATPTLTRRNRETGASSNNNITQLPPNSKAKEKTKKPFTDDDIFNQNAVKDITANKAVMDIINKMPKASEMPKMRGEESASKGKKKSAQSAKIEEKPDEQAKDKEAVDNERHTGERSGGSVEVQPTGESNGAGTERGESGRRGEEPSGKRGSKPAVNSGNNAGSDEGRVQERSEENGRGTEKGRVDRNGTDERGAEKPVKEEPQKITPEADKIERKIEKKEMKNADDIPGHDYVIKPIEHRTATQRYKDNVAAIKLLKKIESENRKATPSEQEILARYSGWGGLTTEFTKNEKELDSILTPKEKAAAKAGVVDAFYTPPEVVKFMWDAARRMGFTHGRVLDPSMGTGNFEGSMPLDMRSKSSITGVELDDITSRIARQLYQTARVVHSGFENFNPADNYFIAKMGAKVRPGGLVMVVTSSNTMDGEKDSAVLRHNMGKDFVLEGAVRLPVEAFGESGTDVTTDVLVFRKKGSEDQPGGKYYGQSVFNIDEIFEENPDLNIGYKKYAQDRYGKWKYIRTLKDPRDEWSKKIHPEEAANYPELNLEKELAKRVYNFPENIYQSKKAPAANTRKAAVEAVKDDSASIGSIVKNKDGLLGVVEIDESAAKVIKPFPKNAQKKMREFVDIKNALDDVLVAQTDPKVSDAELSEKRQTLKDKYNQFVKENGYLNDKNNLRHISKASSAGRVLALENYER